VKSSGQSPECLLDLLFAGQKIDTWGILEIFLDHFVSVFFSGAAMENNTLAGEQPLMEQAAFSSSEIIRLGFWSLST
jgi:hypothetical protein